MKKLLLSCFALLISTQLFAQEPLKIGAKAPLFSLKDNAGKQVDLKKILKENKSVVLFFYRGQWCPHCNKHIKNLQDSLQLLAAKGAYVIGISPETAAGIDKTIKKTKASFSIISDKDYNVMKAYKVNYVMEPGLAERYKKGGLDVALANGQTDYVLPVPATYIIDQSGKIKYVFFDKDYKKRPSVKNLAANL
ncbi:peroxiredoxin family protein [Pedobacter cryotolerans]|uniref:thioredoxin-dependent peroxiredoxin n=1 Tax=Pedobacter cryotolerans TaxID=2571270 RepID=A0A4U1C6X0_9SPHI|nr:peroxiredoxin family protein [Pedobacter cryotolerans]TKC01255.1 AhpC/TSA family protein [Pedobacter cryotolerans]